MTRRLMQLTFATSLAAGILMWAAPALAQNGSMSGRVVDSERRTLDRDGKPMAGHQNPTDFMIALSEAHVIIEFKGEPAKKFDVLTDLDGLWYKGGLAPGTYDISVRREWKDPDTSRTPDRKIVVFVASVPGVVLKPGDKLKLPDIHALTEASIAAGHRPPTAASAPPPGMSNSEIEATNKRNAELNTLLKDANGLFDSGKYEESITKYLAVAAKLEGSDQSCARCYVKAGEANVKLKKNDEAEKMFVKALEVDENLGEAYSQLASLYNGMGKLEDAARMSAKANELMAKTPAGGDPVSLFNAGVIAWNSGKAAEARDAFARVVKVDPRNAKAQYYLGLSTFSAASGGDGKVADAKAPLQEYLRLDPTGEFAETAKAILATIK
jgi:tetratricopeptide (TPR) repeat protein